MYNWYNSLKGGVEIGATSRILFDGFADQESEESVEENGSHGVRDYQKSG
jgi:hypothetical protein